MLAGRDRLHWAAENFLAKDSCGLLAGRDRLHYARVDVFYSGVAACSRAGIGYTPSPPNLLAVTDLGPKGG